MKWLRGRSKLLAPDLSGVGRSRSDVVEDGGKKEKIKRSMLI